MIAASNSRGSFGRIASSTLAGASTSQNSGDQPRVSLRADSGVSISNSEPTVNQAMAMRARTRCGERVFMAEILPWVVERTVGSPCLTDRDSPSTAALLESVRRTWCPAKSQESP